MQTSCNEDKHWEAKLTTPAAAGDRSAVDIWAGSVIDGAGAAGAAEGAFASSTAAAFASSSCLRSDFTCTKSSATVKAT